MTNPRLKPEHHLKKWLEESHKDLVPIIKWGRVDVLIHGTVNIPSNLDGLHDPKVAYHQKHYAATKKIYQEEKDVDSQKLLTVFEKSFQHMGDPTNSGKISITHMKLDSWKVKKTWGGAPKYAEFSGVVESPNKGSGRISPLPFKFSFTVTITPVR